jgi:hypothetical protein
MELPNSSALFTLATLAMTFVGFTAIVVILRQSLGNVILSSDALVARLFMVCGFTITDASIMPVLLAAYDFSQSAIWQLSSIIAGISLLVINFGYPLLRARATGERTPLHVWLHVAASLIIALIFFLSATERLAKTAPAIYVTALTLYLIQASFAFVQHFGFMLEEMNTKSRRRKI